MASPAPIAPHGWNNNGQTMPPANDYDDSGLQVRPMGLKVHYTFDKEGKVNCLARSPQTLQVQTIPLDEKTAIGVVDLRVCLRAVTECSPELAGQEEDYTVYALDYSEPDTPLVGQGMLSWALETMNNDRTGQPPKMVTGRVTRNALAVFGGGNRETLEVRLKLTAAPKVQRPQPQLQMSMDVQPQLPIGMEIQPARPMERSMTPTGASEWNSFLQSNPQIGHSAHVSRVASPALSQGPPPMPMSRRDSFGPVSLPAPSAGPQEPQRVAPTPVDPATLPPQPTSRPSSRTSRRKAPTGRPRGRPRKKPAEGNTSGYEDGTEGEDGPAKKRAKTTKVDKVVSNPFGAGPESLRVAASISGSIRNFRPIGNNDGPAGNHLQEVPRAPTPVPEGGPMAMQPRAQNMSKLRRESSMSQEFNPNFSNQYNQKPARALSPSQEDGRSPESGAPTPNYSEDSPQDIGSSPPVPRTTPYMRSSPPPSSPMLPPMPQLQPPPESSFMDEDVEALFDEMPLQALRELQGRPQASIAAPMEIEDSTGIPSQVFRLRDGPDGQAHIVHIQNYNNPQPAWTPAMVSYQPEPLALPPLEKDAAPLQPRPIRPRSQKRKQKPQPTLAPTPPPTTDSFEKAPSPIVGPDPSPEVESTETESPVEPTEPAQLVDPALFDAQMPTPRESLPAPAPKNPPKQRPNRQFNRSQSAGALALPAVPASSPAGPSSLSQSLVPEASRPTKKTSAKPRRNSVGPTSIVPASDPAGPTPPSLVLPTPAFSEAPCPPSDLPTPSSPPHKSSKNLVKKQSIKQKLEEAILNGEMPPFCTNCGAINTPTWRKIWVQDREGIPEYVEYSEKPGRITAIDILKRDDEEKPLSYRLIKKSLGKEDNKNAWLEQLLCNPCGIWLTKYKTHRPLDKWDNSFGRGPRDRKRTGVPSNSRSRKARTKSDSQPNLNSEAYLATDAAEPSPPSPKAMEAAPRTDSQPGDEQSRESEASRSGPSRDDADRRSNPGSTHSRGSGTARSPIAVDMDMDEHLGSTRRLLFPSPRKDGELRVLGEVNINVVQTGECRQNKGLTAEKENVAVLGNGETRGEHDDLEALFRSPVQGRPSTPPPPMAKASAGPFKTPTRPTPNHRPITRSVSRSLRSVRGMSSPGQLALLQRTPTQTPRGSLVPGSTSRRRSPRNHQVNLEDIFDTPITRAINQVLSEPNFDLGHSDLDLSSLPALDTHESTLYDFGNLLSTDPAAMPSSPPKDLAFDFNAGWSQWGMDSDVPMQDEA